MTTRAGHHTAEHRRLEEARDDGKKWRRWGTYLAERQWGTVREDYSADGEAWDYLPFEHAAARAYRWGDDGLLGVSDNRGLVNLGVVLVPRRYPDRELRPRALQVPTDGVPVRGSRRAGAGAGQERPRVRAARHPRVRRVPLLRRDGEVRQGGRQRPALRGDGAQPGARPRDARRPSPAMVPQHLELGPGDAGNPEAGALRRRPNRRRAPRHVGQRKVEADEYFEAITPRALGADERRVFRQAIAGLVWGKQYYAYDVERWLRGDALQPAPPRARWLARNHEWRHLYKSEVLSMPDKWEYPWYAAWDLAFHCVPYAIFDAEFAKQQLTLLTREWNMHPSGQLPA